MKKFMLFIIVITIIFSFTLVYAQQFKPGEVDVKGIIPMEWGKVIAITPVMPEKNVVHLVFEDADGNIRLVTLTRSLEYINDWSLDHGRKVPVIRRK